jgi:hypothetical protein
MSTTPLEPNLHADPRTPSPRPPEPLEKPRHRCQSRRAIAIDEVHGELPSGCTPPLDQDLTAKVRSLTEWVSSHLGRTDLF